MRSWLLAMLKMGRLHRRSPIELKPPVHMLKCHWVLQHIDHTERGVRKNLQKKGFQDNPVGFKFGEHGKGLSNVLFLWMAIKHAFNLLATLLNLNLFLA